MTIKSVFTPSGTKLRAEVDPTGKWPNLAEVDLLESLGILPHWATNKKDDEGFAEAFERQYPFWCGRTDSGKTYITEEGIYQYPEDPDLAPILMLHSDDEVVYFYRYALVAIVNKLNDDVFVTRMD